MKKFYNQPANIEISKYKQKNKLNELITRTFSKTIPELMIKAQKVTKTNDECVSDRKERMCECVNGSTMKRTKFNY